LIKDKSELDDKYQKVIKELEELKKSSSKEQAEEIAKYEAQIYFLKEEVSEKEKEK